MRDYFITRAARRDVDDAYEWYEQFEAGRGDEFLIELHDAIREARANPFVCIPISSRSRGMRMRRSRFIVYFRVEDTRIVVFAVRHESSDDAMWRMRM